MTLSLKFQNITSEALRRLDHRARVVLGLFAGKETITAPVVAKELRLSERMARNRLKDWVEDGWLKVTNPSRRARAYSLLAKYRQYVGSSSATPSGEKNELSLLRMRSKGDINLKLTRRNHESHKSNLKEPYIRERIV